MAGKGMAAHTPDVEKLRQFIVTCRHIKQYMKNTKNGKLWRSKITQCPYAQSCPKYHSTLCVKFLSQPDLLKGLQELGALNTGWLGYGLGSYGVAPYHIDQGKY